VIHFVEATKALKAEFRMYDRLFTLENPGKNDHFEQLIDPESLVVTYGVVEPGMANAEPEVAYQFEREGYYCRDSKDVDEIVFNKTVSLRDTWSN
jgi:glutaminyl-tRNA synthetase